MIIIFILILQLFAYFLKYIIKVSLHAHQKFDLQVGQLQTLKALNLTLGTKKINIYIQQTPNDATMQYISGSLSSGAKRASLNDKNIPVLLSRFLWPSFKIYQIITEYTMSEQDFTCKGSLSQNIYLILKGIMIAFWNGNGIYLPKNLEFYDKRVIAMLKKCNLYYNQYKDYFQGKDASPLDKCDISKGVNQILSNKFINQLGKQIYVLLNWSQQFYSSEIDEIKIRMPAQSIGIIAYGKYQLIYTLCFPRPDSKDLKIS